MTEERDPDGLTDEERALRVARRIRTGTFSAKQHTLMIQVAVPEDLASDSVDAFLRDAIRQSMVVAEDYFRSRGQDWSLGPVRAAAEEVIARALAPG